MPGSKYWWFRWTQAGERHAVSLKTEDESEAITKARAVLAEDLFKRPSFGDYRSVVNAFLRESQHRLKKPMRPETAKTMGFILGKFAKDCDIEFVGQITPAVLTRWVQFLRTSGLSNETVHTYIVRLKTFLRYLEVSRHIRSGLLDQISSPEHAPQGRKNWIHKQIVRQIIAAVKPRVYLSRKTTAIEKARRDAQDLKFILYSGFHAGLRKNEIAMAKVSWFDLGQGLIHAQNMPDEGFILKDRDNRTIDMTREFNAFLAEYLKGRNPGEFVVKPHKAKGAWRYRYDFGKTLASHFKRVGVECSAHDMRRSFASNAVSSGVPIYTVAKWLGDGVQVVERSYGHLAPNTGEINKVV
jgi:integrase